jgi:hypothetical protein
MRNLLSEVFTYWSFRIDSPSTSSRRRYVTVSCLLLRRSTPATTASLLLRGLWTPVFGPGRLEVVSDSDWAADVKGSGFLRLPRLEVATMKSTSDRIVKFKREVPMKVNRPTENTVLRKLLSDWNTESQEPSVPNTADEVSWLRPKFQSSFSSKKKNQKGFRVFPVDSHQWSSVPDRDLDLHTLSEEDFLDIDVF